MSITNNIFKLALPLCAMLCVACSSDDDDAVIDNTLDNPSDGMMSFSADLEGDNTTRTTTTYTNNAWSTVWNPDATETIRIWNTLGDKKVSNFTAKANSYSNDCKTASFEGTSIVNAANVSNDYYAFYPSQGVMPFDTSTKTITANLPNVQTAVMNGVDAACQLMTGHTTTYSVSFKNVCALLKITIASNDGAGVADDDQFSIGVIKIVSNDTNEKIAGAFTATISGSGDTEGTVTSINCTGSTFAEVRANSDGTAKLADGTYYIAVLPVTLTNGFTLYLEDVGRNKVYQQVANKGGKVTFTRSKVLDLGSFNSTTYNGKILSNVVDLGLPSGTLWTTKNIDGYDTSKNQDKMFTANDYDYGQYYAWAEDFGYGEKPNQSHQNNVGGSYGTSNWTSQGIGDNSWSRSNKTDYRWDNYKWNDGLTTGIWSNNTTKYQSGIMDITDDIAYLKSGGRYCMPTKDQIKELMGSSCSKTDETVSSKKCVKFTSSITSYTSRYIRLPKAGAVYNQVFSFSDTHDVGSKCQYWSRTLYDRLDAYSIDYPTVVNDAGDNLSYDRRFSGRTIRAVVTNAAIAPLLLKGE